MIHSTKGIVLTHTKYSETSIIVHIYTQLFGKQSYLINSVRSTKNKGKSVFMQPLTIIEMQVYYNSKKQIQRIKEFSVFKPFKTIPFIQEKRSIAFFLTEILEKSIHEETSNHELFNFIEKQLWIFDDSENTINFHLKFLAGLTRKLGFFPNLTNKTFTNYFDLQNGTLEKHEPIHSYFIENNIVQKWIDLFEASENEYTNILLNNYERNYLINTLIDYYRLHLHDFGKLKTLDILRSIHIP
ncbi:MAG: DNA repair protein RecO [Bacteroidales bacterium]|nr:DNA repair protein RecO [Bacteroidales bacterium]